MARRVTLQLADGHGLHVRNDGSSTYYSDNTDHKAVIDLTLSGPGIEVSRWRVLDGEDEETVSDRQVIGWVTPIAKRGEIRDG